jgi:hypothetical protein
LGSIRRRTTLENSMSRSRDRTRGSSKVERDEGS